MFFARLAEFGVSVRFTEFGVSVRIKLRSSGFPDLYGLPCLVFVVRNLLVY